MAVLPKRKHPRLKTYDYSKNGHYYVTICTQNKLPLLSTVTVGRGLAPAEITLTPIGKIIEEQLLDLQNRYPFVTIHKYVIMPTHIHVLMILHEAVVPLPTLMDIVCTFKSLSTRLCNQHDNIQGRKIWQTSFYDEIITTDKAYDEIWQYIDENPSRWLEDKYHSQ